MGHRSGIGTYNKNEGRNYATEDPYGCLEKAFLVAKQGEDTLFKHERRAKRNGKGPTKHATNGKPEHPFGSLDSAAPVDERRST